MRLLNKEQDPGVRQEDMELAQAAFDRMCRDYGYQAESVRDALGELLARRYKG